MIDSNDRIAAYADGELGEDQARAVEQLLAVDESAREKLRVQREMTSLLRGAFAERAFEPSAEIRDRLLTPTSPSAPPRFRLRSMMAVAASLAAIAMSFVAGTYFGRGQPMTGMAELIEEVSAYHTVFARETDHLVEVPASRSAELSEWLGDRLGRKLTIPDLSSTGRTFAGGRMLVVNGQPVAQLLYVRPGQLPLGVCITRSSDPSSVLKTANVRGLDLGWWIDGGYTHLLVGTIAADELQTLADLVANAIRG